MNRFRRRLLWFSAAAVGASGLVYLWMKYFLEPADEWAVINHPWEPWFLKAHILTAPVLLFAVGLIATDHIWRHYRSRLPTARRSGLLLAGVLAPMIATGYLIQVVTHEATLNVLVWVHVATGVAFILGLGMHSFVLVRRRRRRRAGAMPVLNLPEAAAVRRFRREGSAP